MSGRRVKSNRKLSKLAEQVELSYFCQNAGITLDGRPFSFKNHEYLIDIYQDDSPRKLYKKGAQMGFSTLEMLSSVWGCKNLYPTGILYLFPTKDDVTDFSKSRFTRLISENPNTIGKWVGSTESANIKDIGGAFLYLRGSRTRTALKSIPVDKLVFDEFDEMRPGSGKTSEDKSVRFDPITLARERYSHSEFQHEDILSTPTLPDYGIEKEFEKSDQKHWYIRCEHCNYETCLELTFPECLRPSKNGVIRACKKCGGEIHPRNGRWVPRYSGRDLSGYYISQLNSVYINPKTIWDLYRNLDNMTPLQRLEFWNSKLGMGYVETRDRLTKQQVYALCDSAPMADKYIGDPGPCVMGVDQDTKNVWAVVGKKMSDRYAKIVYLGILDDWNGLDELMENFNVWQCVADAAPEKRNARKFADKYPGKVFLNYYNHHQKGSAKWNWRDLIVQENRTESLDTSHELIMKEMVILPRRCHEVEIFAEHCHNTAKKLQEDEETGSLEYVYVKLGADHFRHALNYFTIAMENAPVSKHDNDGSGVESFRRGGFMKARSEPLCNCYH